MYTSLAYIRTMEQAKTTPVDRSRTSRRKLHSLAEKMHAYAKANNLCVFIMFDGAQPGAIKHTGHYNAYVAKHVIGHMALSHPELFRQTTEEINRMMEERTGYHSVAGPVEQIDSPSGVVDPTLKVVKDGDELISPAVDEHPEA